MITYTHQEKEYKLKSSLSEITLEEYFKVSDLTNEELNNKSFVMRWLDVVDLLGTKGLSDIIDDEGLFAFIQSINEQSINQEAQGVIEIKGIKYTANLKDGKVLLSGKEMGLINERIAKTGGKGWQAYAFATVYKEENATRDTHLNHGHILKKESLFKKHVKADIAAPILFQIGIRITENLEKLSKVNANTSAV